MKEGPPELVLQLLNLLAQRRLGNEALFRGPAEVSGLSDGHQVSELMEFHRRFLSNISKLSISLMACQLLQSKTAPSPVHERTRYEAPPPDTSHRLRIHLRCLRDHSLRGARR